MLNGVINALGWGADLREKASTPISANNAFAQEVQNIETTATEKFLKYQKMTAAEKFRASYLAEKKLTEEDLIKMSAEDRFKIEQEIAKRIREKIAQSVSNASG